MYNQIGTTLINGNQVSLYRLNRTGMTVYTVHTDTSIVNGFFVFLLVSFFNNRLLLPRHWIMDTPERMMVCHIHISLTLRTRSEFLTVY